MPDFLSRDPVFLESLRIAERAAAASSNVLIVGESGTGKSRMARWIHAHGARSEAPLVEVACANVPPELFESEMFGHEAGAFTDAREARAGRLERADRGTLFLDDLQELDLAAQAKLLRAIEERRFERIGGRSTLEVDIRVLSSARGDPQRLIAAGRLREDLLYRLDVLRIEMVPLRRRPADIPALAERLLEELAERHGGGPKRLAPETIEHLVAHPWPGNVRELRHAIERGVILSAAELLMPSDLSDAFSVAASSMILDAAEREITLADLERAYIDEVLRKTRGNKSAAARILGIHRKTLHEKLRA
ncbi:MAG TPA: sigma-54 dependent transcriptional regulator [Candidatus Polarisedimenticolaceae bacterium]|nr:sigma-54 dependent transcriptional regulator [Candidatus Polarisedimenticolaceae bacterium]